MDNRTIRHPRGLDHKIQGVSGGPLSSGKVVQTPQFGHSLIGQLAVRRKFDDVVAKPMKRNGLRQNQGLKRQQGAKRRLGILDPLAIDIPHCAEERRDRGGGRRSYHNDNNDFGAFAHVHLPCQRKPACRRPTAERPASSHLSFYRAAAGCDTTGRGRQQARRPTHALHHQAATRSAGAACWPVLLIR